MLQDVAIATPDQNKNLSVIEQVVVQGDLSKLTPIERVTYYKKVCESMGLNPLTKPFDYILLGGKLTLYARKDCTEQLRKIHGVSIEDLQKQVIDDIYIVNAKARDRSGRTDESTGAVNIGNLKGEAKANAIMKAETKAKRRVTLSICGLGWCDETEIETIPDAKKIPVNIETGEISVHCEEITQKSLKNCDEVNGNCDNSQQNAKISPLQLEEILTLARQIDETCRANMEAYLLKTYNIASFEDIPQKAFASCVRGMMNNINMNKHNKI